MADNPFKLSNLGQQPAVEADQSKIGDLRRRYNFGASVSELAIDQTPFFRFISQVGNSPTDDPEFKSSEERSMWHKRYAYLVAMDLDASSYGDDESGMARCMMFLCKREFYDQIEAEDYVKKGIWTSSPWSCDYRDMTGNITWYCREKKYPFLILENSFEDSHRVANYKKRHHIINITEGLHDTEQAWCDGIPIWFHHGRGGYRPSGSLDEWITQTTNYLKSNKGTFDAENGQYIW